MNFEESLLSAILLTSNLYYLLTIYQSKFDRNLWVSEFDIAFEQCSVRADGERVSDYWQFD